MAYAIFEPQVSVGMPPGGDFWSDAALPALLGNLQSVEIAEGVDTQRPLEPFRSSSAQIVTRVSDAVARQEPYREGMLCRILGATGSAPAEPLFRGLLARPHYEHSRAGPVEITLQAYDLSDLLRQAVTVAASTTDTLGSAIGKVLDALDIPWPAVKRILAAADFPAELRTWQVEDAPAVDALQELVRSHGPPARMMPGRDGEISLLANLPDTRVVLHDGDIIGLPETELDDRNVVDEVTLRYFKSVTSVTDNRRSVTEGAGSWSGRVTGRTTTVDVTLGRDDYNSVVVDAVTSSAGTATSEVTEDLGEFDAGTLVSHRAYFDLDTGVKQHTLGRSDYIRLAVTSVDSAVRNPSGIRYTGWNVQPDGASDQYYTGINALTPRPDGHALARAPGGTVSNVRRFGDNVIFTVNNQQAQFPSNNDYYVALYDDVAGSADGAASASASVSGSTATVRRSGNSSRMITGYRLSGTRRVSRPVTGGSDVYVSSFSGGTARVRIQADAGVTVTGVTLTGTRTTGEVMTEVDEELETTTVRSDQAQRGNPHPLQYELLPGIKAEDAPAIAQRYLDAYERGLKTLKLRLPCNASRNQARVLALRPGQRVVYQSGVLQQQLEGYADRLRWRWEGVSAVLDLTVAVDQQQFAVPSSLALTTPRGGQVSATWMGAPGARGYQVQWKRTDAQWDDTTIRDVSGLTTLINRLDQGVTYDVRVRAVYDAGSSEWAEDSIVVSLVAAPGGLTLTSPRDGQINATWTAAAGATGYQVQWKRTDAQVWAPAEGTTHLTYQIDGRDRDVSYDVRVRARQPGGVSAWVEDSIVVFRATAPSGLTLTSPRGGQVNATWTAAAGATGYQVQWKRTDAQWDDTTIRAGAGTNTVIDGLDQGVTYDVRVRAVYGAGVSAWVQDSIVVLLVAAPGGLTLTSPRDGEISATWTAAAGATGYQVQWATAGSAYDAAGIRDVAGLTTDITAGLQPGQTYKVRVRAVHAASGNSAWVEDSILISGQAPLTLSASRDGQISASWQAVAGVFLYQLQWRRNDAGYGSSQYPTGTTATLSGAEAGATYYVRVRALFRRAPSSVWVEASVTVPV